MNLTLIKVFSQNRQKQYRFVNIMRYGLIRCGKLEEIQKIHCTILSTFVDKLLHTRVSSSIDQT